MISKPRRLGRGDPIPASWLRQVSESIVQRLQVAGAPVRRIGTGIAIGASREPVGARRARRYRVNVIENDYLEVGTWDGTTEGTAAVYIAKPFKLRHIAGHYAGLTGLTTSTAQEVSATNGSEVETWVGTPSYAVDDEIYAVPCQGTGVTVGGEDVTLIDLNSDGRAWAVEAA